MIKLRLSEVEDALQSPASFRGGSSSGAPRRLSMTRALVYSVYAYHRQREDLARAVQHFEDMFHRNFKRLGRLPQLLDQLAQYHAQFQALSNPVVNCPVRIAIAVDADLQVTGEIGRLDLAPGGGYAAWLFAGISYDWRSELRMALIQAHFAQLMVVEPEKVAVGFYFFDPGEHQSVRYSAREIDSAFAKARRLGSALTP